MLLDSARLQEEEAGAANRYGSSKHRPALPLYAIPDAEAALDLVQRRPNHVPFDAAPGVTAAFQRAGHILGAASIAIRVGDKRLLYSGDLGRWHRPILHDPDPASDADVVLIESTYGNRLHPAEAAEDLAAEVRAGVQRGGAILIPSFTVGRAQELLWTLRSLEASGRIPSLPVFVDSPMATDVSDLYLRHSDEHDIEMRSLIDDRRSPFRTRRFDWLHSVAESRRLNGRKGSFIVVAGSGMATGGRILHHLRERIHDQRTTVLLPGYQALGTRGRTLQEGGRTIRIFGEELPVRAHIATVDGFSAHADKADLLRWLSSLRRAPASLWIVHGEPESAEALRLAIVERFGWNAQVATDGGVAQLTL